MKTTKKKPASPKMLAHLKRLNASRRKKPAAKAKAKAKVKPAKKKPVVAVANKAKAMNKAGITKLPVVTAGATITADQLSKTTITTKELVGGSIVLPTPVAPAATVPTPAPALLPLGGEEML